VCVCVYIMLFFAQFNFINLKKNKRKERKEDPILFFKTIYSIVNGRHLTLIQIKEERS